MFTTTKLIVCWAALGIACVAGNSVHDNLKKDVELTSAREAPPYVPVTDAEAIRLEYENCKNDSSYSVMLLQSGSSCQEFFSQPSDKVVELARRGHRIAYESREVEPRVRARRLELRNKFEMFDYALIIAAAAVFLLWCKSTVLPRIIALKDAVSERTPSANDLKAMGASRKVRQAESDFRTLKNLHDNGLINDEMFEKRKAQIKTGLSTNQMFQD